MNDKTSLHRGEEGNKEGRAEGISCKASPVKHNEEREVCTKRGKKECWKDVKSKASTYTFRMQRLRK